MTELGILNAENRYAKIEIIKNKCSMAVKNNNQNAIALANNLVLHAKSKHIDIQHHYIKDKVQTRRINLTYIPTETMVANSLTKPLLQVKSHRFLQQIRI